MKTSIKLLASAFFVLLSLASALADDHGQKKAFTAVVYPAVDAAKLWVCLEKYQTESEVYLELIDEQGNVLVHETVCYKNSKPHSYRQRFDISQLKDGNYTFRISAGSQKETIPFKLATPVQETPSRFVAIK